MEMLFGGNGRKDDLSYEGVHVVDPTEGIDETLDLTIEAGVITSESFGAGFWVSAIMRPPAASVSRPRRAPARG